MLKHIRNHYPVGQGYFHSALVQIEGTSINYCYDCGSENPDPLHNEVKRYTEKHSVIDILFLSHLDYDHVSGLDELLALCSTETVVLPYLTDFERLYLLSEVFEYGRVSGEYTSLLGDPIKWFAQRGIKNIILIKGDENDDAPPTFPEDTPYFPPSSPKKQIDRQSEHQEFSPINKIMLDFNRIQMYKQPTTSSASQAAVYIVPNTHVFRLTDNASQPVNWGFITFVHPEKQRETTFKEAFEREFVTTSYTISMDSHTDITDTLTCILKDPQERNRLAECYKVIRENRNLTSLSLYSGPLVMMPNFKFSYRRTFKNKSTTKPQHVVACGWLGTGDADLKGIRRRKKFKNHFGRIYSSVLNISLPHHGSKLSYDEDIIPANCEVCTLSAATKNSYSHPHSDVTVSVQRQKKKLFQSSEKPETLFVESIELE